MTYPKIPKTIRIILKGIKADDVRKKNGVKFTARGEHAHQRRVKRSAYKMAGGGWGAPFMEWQWWRQKLMRNMAKPSDRNVKPALKKQRNIAPGGGRKLCETQVNGYHIPPVVGTERRGWLTDGSAVWSVIMNATICEEPPLCQQWREWSITCYFSLWQ